MKIQILSLTVLWLQACSGMAVRGDPPSDTPEVERIDDQHSREGGTETLECPPLGPSCPEGCTAILGEPIVQRGADICVEDAQILGCWIPPEDTLDDICCVSSPDRARVYTPGWKGLCGHLIQHGGYHECTSDEWRIMTSALEGRSPCKP